MKRLAELYRDLHAHPELAFAEHRTAGIAATEARALGCEVTEGVGRTGVVALLRNGPGPTVLLRADMDALPVTEATGLSYASRQPGLMHACGHDMHVTWLLGALQALADRRDRWSGTALAVFQPAEENGGGAQVMIDDGLFDRFGQPAVILGQHVVPLPAGKVGHRGGPAMAASDALKVRLFGRGGHGSRPETTVDPVVMAASAVLRLQTVVSRELPPTETAVLTVGAIHAGSATNIIPAEAELQLSLRSFDPGVRERALAAIRRILDAEAAAAGAPLPPEITRIGGYPVLVNDADATHRTIAAIAAELGAEQTTEMPLIMGSEDFGSYAAATGVPSCFWFVGGTDPQRYAAAEAAGTLDEEIPTNHSPLFAPVLEPTLQTGVRTLTAAALTWLKVGPTRLS